MHQLLPKPWHAVQAWGSAGSQPRLQGTHAEADALSVTLVVRRPGEQLFVAELQGDPTSP